MWMCVLFLSFINKWFEVHFSFSCFHSLLLAVPFHFLFVCLSIYSNIYLFIECVLHNVCSQLFAKIAPFILGVVYIYKNSFNCEFNVWLTIFALHCFNAVSHCDFSRIKWHFKCSYSGAQIRFHYSLDVLNLFNIWIQLHYYWLQIMRSLRSFVSHERIIK